MKIQWTANGNRDAGSSCLCDRGLHRYLQNFGGGGFEHPKPPLSVRHWSVSFRSKGYRSSVNVIDNCWSVISCLHVFSFCGCSKPRLLSLRPKSSAQHPVPRSPSDRPKCWSAARLRGVFPPRDCAVRNTRIVFFCSSCIFTPCPSSVHCTYFSVPLCMFSVVELSMWPVSKVVCHTFRRVSRWRIL